MAMAIADASHVIDEVWFVAEGSVVKILNFAGTVKGNIFILGCCLVNLQGISIVHLPEGVVTFRVRILLHMWLNI